MIDDVMPPRRQRPKLKHVQPPTSPEPTPVKPPGKPAEPAFKTPEEAAHEDVILPATPEQPDTTPELKPEKRARRLWPHTRKQWIITSAVFVVLVGGVGVGSWLLLHHKKPMEAATIIKTPKKTVPAATLYSTLSGLPITNASLNQKPVTAVMIENSTDARPQSGLSQAGVVFEALAEGGITRFMALYQDTTPTNVGPIRSARPYYIQWALGFDAAYAHVGGSPDALSDITSWNVQDMNQFYYGDYYHRITTREAPHNVYTGINNLNQLEASKGYTSQYTGFPRASKQAPMSAPTASSIDFTMSGPLYNPHYAYDATTNSYNRSTDGTPDVDANTNQQLSPTVVIAIVTPLSQGALDASGAYYSDYNVLGTGTAYVFQNGGVTIGQWNKTSNSSQITFTNSDGSPILLNRGQTWITAVASSNDVSYTGTAPAAK